MLKGKTSSPYSQLKSDRAQRLPPPPKPDISRNSDLFQIPTRFPTAFPTNSLKAQRALMALKQQRPEKLVEASRALWQCYWRDQGDLASDADLVRVLTPVLGEPAVRALLTAGVADKAIKDGLLRATQEAAELGAFGAPWIQVTVPGKEPVCFFGSDRFEQMAMFVGEIWVGPVPSKASL
ncbi:thioredoxin-like protein [Blyttiomyces helicus]|uniref:Thioredoxin-like protein n=1 Tax=Blyttiomyces helicus TaxID=388810 RepID=A0A4P9W6V1_9FUNG|nr:thioredoxin-like protein [Blyttiomyces helicus]|eukprot:RKO88189.1 thioredoxin-like protein [Blyttiomyces helicus]